MRLTISDAFEGTIRAARLARRVIVMIGDTVTFMGICNTRSDDKVEHGDLERITSLVCECAKMSSERFLATP
jgi:hypothetical protein